MPHFDLDLFSLESDPHFGPFLDYLSENEELVCSLKTAVQFENLEICRLIKRMSNDGLVEMTPGGKDLESLSLRLTEKGRYLACSFSSGGGSISNLIPVLYQR